MRQPELSTLVATPWQESTGTCACCGHASRKIWGDISAEDNTLAVYFVHWTVGSPEHTPNIDLIIGAWGEGSEPKDRLLVSLLFQPSQSGGSFMVIDATERVNQYDSLFGKPMLRAEVVGTPFAPEVFALVDSIWLTEPRIEAVKELNNVA
jgi:hypothetical protein